METTPGAPSPHPPIHSTTIVEPKAAPLHVIVDQPRTGGWRRRILWTVLTLSILANVAMYGETRKYYDAEKGIEERYHSLSRHSSNKVAILEVSGTILAGSESFAKKQIDRIREDRDVKAVVLRVDSPGGTVTGSDYLYHHLKKLTKDRGIPLVVSMGSVAASGGYYVAMAAGDNPRSIYAEPTTWTGSVGVIIPHYDISDLLLKWNVKDDSIASAKFKQMGSLTRHLSDAEKAEERALLQGLVDDSFSEFKDIVLASRAGLREHAEWQQNVFSGRIFTAKQAKANGLVDELGFVEDAIRRAIDLAALDPADTCVVKYHHRSDLLDALMSSKSSLAPAGQFDVAALLDLTAPRAYYLCTLVPGLRWPE